MIEWLFAFLVIYLLYKLVFDFIIPVYKTTSQIRDKVNHMNQRQQQFNQQKSSSTVKSSTTKVKPAAEDYIDFEEIK